jgi:hypothetical protein
LRPGVGGEKQEMEKQQNGNHHSLKSENIPAISALDLFV